MSIINNAYKVLDCPSTISWYNCWNHDLSCIDGSAPYPSCKDILVQVLAEHGNCDSLEDCYNSDALFGFAIRSHLDSVARQSQIENNYIITRVLDIGLYDWKALDRQGGGNQPSVPICYMAVLGLRLLKLVDVLSDQVSSLIQPLLWLRLITRTSSAIKMRFGTARRIKRKSLCHSGWIGS